MKKLLLLLSFVALLPACASVEYGSWLDQIGKRPNPPVEMSPDEAVALRDQAMRLRSEADAIRTQLASETDRVQRFRYYSEIRKIDDELVPIERQLLDARRLSRAPGLAPG
ncbi:hypothetical protein [Caenimonas sp. SL110]|uniref:hypothetical protein n=1 Tax=Caenimonas sp. SL110 TaxID=1450524 RepID=UPI0006542A79|nr:hypothetical protein [Caenimonas sp. SL110]